MPGSIVAPAWSIDIRSAAMAQDARLTTAGADFRCCVARPPPHGVSVEVVEFNQRQVPMEHPSEQDTQEVRNNRFLNRVNQASRRLAERKRQFVFLEDPVDIGPASESANSPTPTPPTTPSPSN